MASGSKCDERVKALAQRVEMIKGPIKFTATIRIPTKASPTGFLQGGEPIMNGQTSFFYMMGVQINGWIFCIEASTKESDTIDPTATMIKIGAPKCIVPDYTKDGVIVAYKGLERCVFKTIKIDKDPRREYLTWVAKTICPLQ